MKNFVLMLGDQRYRYLLVVLSAAIVTGSEATLHPLLMKAIFDAVSQHDSFARFIPLGLMYLALGVVVNAMNYGISLWKMRVDNRIVETVSENLLRAYYAKSYGELLEHGSGHYVARIRSDVRDGLVPMLATVRDCSVAIVTFILLVSVLIYISWQAFLILFLIIPFSTAVSLYVSRSIRRLTNIERVSEATLMDVLTKSIAAFKIVRGFGLRDRAVTNFNGRLRDALESNFGKTRVIRRLQGAGDLTMVVSDVCSIFVGAYFVIRDQMTLGSFIAFMNAFWRSATTLISIFSQYAELHGHSATVDRLAAFMNEHVREPTPYTGHSVSANGIAYSYGSEPVLANFSTEIGPGEHVLILGRNGSGKTTLANILCGHLQPSEGRIELPRNVSGITLPLAFPPLPVRDLPISPALLRTLGIGGADVLAALPETLSAGQQQKLALGLAITKDAELYVLDEPLANLDTASRVIAAREILQRTEGRMLVMIMHDAEELMSMFDRVLVLGETPADRIAATAVS